MRLKTTVIRDFDSRRMTHGDALWLCKRANVEVEIARILPIGLVSPRICGVQTIYVSDAVPHAARPFVILHELTHVIAGDTDEPVRALDRYPVRDRIADGVAAIGVTTPGERSLPPHALAGILRGRVPMDIRAWTRYRSNDVAALIHHQEDEWA